MLSDALLPETAMVPTSILLDGFRQTMYSWPNGSFTQVSEGAPTAWAVKVHW